MTDPSRPRPRPTPSSGDAPASSDAAGSASRDEVPDGGIAVVLPTPARSGNAGAGRGRSRRLAGVRRFLRTPRGKWTVVSALAVIALVAGLLVKGFLSPAAPPLRDAQSPDGAGGLNSVAPTPTSSTSGAANNRRAATPEEIKKELQAKAGQLNNPLNRLRSDGIHSVTISARSSRPLQVVGYLIPTSIDTRNAYGTLKGKRPSFSLTTKAVGPGYLALMFIQADNSGAPVVCSVTIDGKTSSRETTAGPYGRQVCLG